MTNIEMIKKIIGKILEKLSKKPVAESAPATENLKPISLSEMLGGSPEPELRVIGLYSDVNDEKIAELTQALL